jgi:signal transduction histidine kinase
MPGNAPRPKGSVMIVDDTPATLRLLGELLIEAGYSVAEFPDGRSALEAATRFRPDLLLLDVMMPGMDGFETCRRLRTDETLRDLPVIFVSAVHDQASKVRAFAEGGVDFVTKPLQHQEVLARVAAHLRLRRQREEIESQRALLQTNLAKLRELEEQRDRLVRMVVHDLRSPLTAMLMTTECLREEMDGNADAEVLTQLDWLLSSERTLMSMISTILDVSRMEAKRMPLQIERHDLNDVVNAAIRSLGPLLERATIRRESSEEALLAACDADLSRRIVENLLSNAVKFAGARAEVVIRLEREPDWLRLSVADNGPGVPPEARERMFERFGWTSSNKDLRVRSSGIGLSFCRLAAEAQGGQIGFEDSNVPGCVFWVRFLPHAPAPTAPPPSARSNPSATA